MDSTPRFPLFNLSNSKPFLPNAFHAEKRNILNETPYFEDKSKMKLTKSLNEKPLFNLAAKEQKFGESYSFSEPFLKEELQNFETLLIKYGSVKTKILKNEAFCTFLEDYELDLDTSENIGIQGEFDKFKELHNINVDYEKNYMFLEEIPPVTINSQFLEKLSS